MSKKPNFLFIITDQHRADHLGCYGNKVVRTPSIDSLAATGTRWERFYVANPICMPNRASIMTGRMCSVHGARHNGIPLSKDQSTFVELLKDAGYKTGLIGKSHLQSFTGLPATNAYQAEEGKTTPSPGLRDAFKNNRHTPDYDLEVKTQWDTPLASRIDGDFYGFEHVEVAADHADRACGDYLLWARSMRDDFDQLVGPDNALAHNRHSAPQAWRTAVPEELYSTTWIADRTELWLSEQADKDRPFFLQMSFPDPHHPFTPPGKYWDMYSPDDIELPASFDKGKLPPILAKLDALNLRENTVVVFTSDHGDYMGDHGLMLKLLLHYQGLVKVPFIWSEPGHEPNTAIEKGLSSSIDIAATILARAGIQPFNGMQGRDLFSTTPPSAIIIEEDSQRTMTGFDKPQRVRTMVTERYRMSLREGEDWDELYDLQNDPHEVENLYGEPAHDSIRDELTQTMIKRIIELQDRSPLPAYRA